MSIDLSQYDEQFESASSFPTDSIPRPGKHRVVIENIEFLESQYGGHSICWTLRNIDEPGSMKKWSGLSNPDKLRFLKKDLACLGMDDLKRLSDLPKRTEELLGLVVQVSVKTFDKQDGNPGYFVYFDKRLKNPLANGLEDAPF